MPEVLLQVITDVLAGRRLEAYETPDDRHPWRLMFGHGWAAWVCECGQDFGWCNMLDARQHRCVQWRQLVIF